MENIKEKTLYHKVCLQCHKPFDSYGRGARFCSETCQKSHYKRVTQRRKTYDKNAEYESLINKGYRLSMQVAEFLNMKPADEDPNDPYELHHLDGNPLNCSPTNFAFLKKSEHSKIHTKLRDINSTDFLKILKAKPELLEMMKQIYVDYVMAGEDKKVEDLPPELENFTPLALTKRFKIKTKLDL